MTVISVERAGKEIGDYDLPGIKEGLASGYFLPGDYGWYEGLAEWRLLSEIVDTLSTKPQPSASTTVVPSSNSIPDPASLYTLFRGRGPTKISLIRGAKYFYQLKGVVEGPLSKLEMRALLRKKIVEPETMIQCPTTYQWIPCERFPELPKPAANKLLHYEKDARFSTLIQEIPQKIVDHIGGKIDEPHLLNWLMQRIQESGYSSPDYDEGTINDLLCEDRLKLIIKTNKQTWVGYLQYRRGGGNPLSTIPELIGF